MISNTLDIKDFIKDLHTKRGRKIKASFSLDRETLEQFKEICGNGKVSAAIERFMEMVIEAHKGPKK